MKKLVTTLLALAAIATLATSAFATLIMSDAFSYPNGTLIPNGGWANYSSPGAGEVTVASGRAVGTGTNAPDDHKLFRAQPTTAKTYACFDVIIPAPGGAPKPIYLCEL